MSETLLDYAINPTPYPIQASPSTGDPNMASLTLVVSNANAISSRAAASRLRCLSVRTLRTFAPIQQAFSSSLPTGWSVKQQGGLFTFTPDTNDKGQVGGTV